MGEMTSIKSKRFFNTVIKACGTERELETIKSVIEKYSEKSREIGEKDKRRNFIIVNNIQNISPNEFVLEANGPYGYISELSDFPLLKDIAEAAPTAHLLVKIEGTVEIIRTFDVNPKSEEKAERKTIIRQMLEAELIDGILYIEQPYGEPIGEDGEQEYIQKAYFTKSAESKKPSFWHNQL